MPENFAGLKLRCLDQAKSNGHPYFPAPTGAGPRITCAAATPLLQGTLRAVHAPQLLGPRRDGPSGVA